MDKGLLKQWQSAVFKHKKWVLAGIAMLMILGFALKGGAALPVTTQDVKLGTVSKIIEATATVESQTERTIQGQISGEVLEVFKATGDAVKVGDLLALVDVRDIALTIKGLEAQKASLASAMADADAPTPEALRQAEAQMKADAIAWSAATRGYKQAKTLYDSGAASLELLQSAKEGMDSAEQTAIISEAAYGAIRNGLSSHQRDRYQAEIAAVQSQIDQVKVNQDRFRIISPVNGVVTLRGVEPGQMIVAGTPLFEIDDTALLRLAADLLVQDAARINLGTPIRAFDEESGIAVTGTVSKIDPKAFSKLSDLGIEQKRVRVQISLSPGTPILRIGMELDLEAIEAQKDGVPMLSDSAVFRINEKAHVFRIIGGVAKLTPIEVGLEGKNTVEILSGLQVGDRVVDAPGNDLKDGAKVKID